MERENIDLYLPTSMLTGIILAGVYRILGLVHTIQRWGAAKKPEVASH